MRKQLLSFMSDASSTGAEPTFVAQGVTYGLTSATLRNISSSPSVMSNSVLTANTERVDQARIEGCGAGAGEER